MGNDFPETPEEQRARPPKPVDNPDIPVTGDPDADAFEEEPIAEEDFGENPEGFEPPEPPNDLSDIDREFED